MFWWNGVYSASGVTNERVCDFCVYKFNDLCSMRIPKVYISQKLELLEREYLANGNPFGAKGYVSFVNECVLFFLL